MTVFGPDRPAAAVRAISALAVAREAVKSAGWTPSYRDLARLSRAQDERDAYAEYGDSFRHH